MGNNFGVGYPGFPMTGVLSMVMSCTSSSVLLAWLRMRAGGVWPGALAHGAVNATANLGVLFCSAGSTILGPSPAGVIGGIPFVALAVLMWLRLPKRWIAVPEQVEIHHKPA